VKDATEAPQCGFSSAVSELLADLKLPYKNINVPEHNEIKEGVKKFTNCPTIPQLDGQ
jgi:monothiol glutaredoxin